MPFNIKAELKPTSFMLQTVPLCAKAMVFYSLLYVFCAFFKL
jgi:hypothetical protein